MTNSYSVIGSYAPGILGQTIRLAFGANVHPVNGGVAFSGSASLVLALLCQDTNGLFPRSTTIWNVRLESKRIKRVFRDG